MSMNGQLSDLHLSELIEFFCNQRKTGRLKVDYALAPGVFFIKEGELVDAKVGTLNGKDAVFFALTLPSAAFDFSAGMNSSRRTINDSWASVVLEGLRRIDEGVMPEFDAFVGEEEVDEATLDYLSCLEEAKGKEVAAAQADAAQTEAAKAPADKQERDTAAFTPLSMTVEASGGGRSKAMVAGVVAALVLVCAVAAIPVSRRLSRSKEAPAAVPTPQQASAPVEAPVETPASETATAPVDASATDAATTDDAARREQQQRDARERARKQREEAAKNAAQDQTLTTTAPKPATTTPTGAKTVRVQISYDEAGRVTQAAAIGTSPGAEAYAATAVRVARSRHFTPGKAGSTVVTIPIN
ncbi:MAG: DUF4388 domain-containing protein [Pyrinomonadaceae bacterium]